MTDITMETLQPTGQDSQIPREPILFASVHHPNQVDDSMLNELKALEGMISVRVIL